LTNRPLAGWSFTRPGGNPSIARKPGHASNDSKRKANARRQEAFIVSTWSRLD
jgi:hypothetical protein